MFKLIFISLIRLYQSTLSPMLGAHCRHIPTCSHYAVQAIREWGVVKGSIMALKRIVRCHPWGTGGYDPVYKNPRK